MMHTETANWAGPTAKTHSAKFEKKACALLGSPTGTHKTSELISRAKQTCRLICSAGF